MLPNFTRIFLLSLFLTACATTSNPVVNSENKELPLLHLILLLWGGQAGIIIELISLKI